MNSERPDNKDVCIAPGSYAYSQVAGSGKIKVHVGPASITFSGQEYPVYFDVEEGAFVRCDQKDVICLHERAEEGDYIILENPAQGDKHPEDGGAHDLPSSGLQMGHRIVIPGPISFALWPGQIATTVEGHHLRYNQFLMARVYNPDAAKTAQAKAIVSTADEGEEATKPVLARDYNLGERLVIKGNEVSFFIPPTGIEVLADGENFVRDAVTLERLEYCILINENGNKRYEKGPAVVFPLPTEQFFSDQDNRKFRAIELTKMAGLHIKVIADYEEGNVGYKAGEELFITGKDLSIYFPRAEHSIIKYGERDRHFAVAVPAGEGRYVLNRETGQIELNEGPSMLLPDPRDKVVVRRVLSEKEVSLWYPDNEAAVIYNRGLRGMDDNSRGYLSDGDYSRDGVAPEEVMNRYESTSKKELMAEKFVRKTQFTEPRTVILDTKFDGVPAINVWTGYAVLIVDKQGNREVHIGPHSILLKYDESLQILELSTGKPKNTDKLQRTVYLRIRNNKISDVVEVETSDHVKVAVKVSLLVNFEGDGPEKWFEAENYVKLLCDHVRSVLKGVVQRTKIEDFYSNHVSIVRDAILGAQGGDGNRRKGMPFDENAMRVFDVEVLAIDIKDSAIRDMLMSSQRDAMQQSIDLKRSERELKTYLRSEEVSMKQTSARTETQLATVTHELALNSRGQELDLAKTERSIAVEAEKQKVEEARQLTLSTEHTAELGRKQELQVFLNACEQDVLNRSKEETEFGTKSVVEKFKAFDGPLSEALLALNRDEVLVKVAEATSVQQLVGGKSVTEVLENIFKGTPYVDRIKQLGRLVSNNRDYAKEGVTV